ncbi:hypothetical protein HY949_05565 [Candidatus Gottesmanbacteria bacterium]|nr:hypothetical protein [Candidatus Gottesmanbacteria bacterium]
MVRLRKAGDLLLQRLLSRQQFMLLDEVGFPVNILVKIGIQKTLEFAADDSYLLPLALSKRTTGLGNIRFFTFYLF